MVDNLNDLLDAVVDEASFMAFIGALIADRILANETKIDTFGRDGNGWENHSIEDFLGAASAWANASKFGKNQGLSDTNMWKKFAVFLYCGKIYE